MFIIDKYNLSKLIKTNYCILLINMILKINVYYKKNKKLTPENK